MPYYDDNGQPIDPSDPRYGDNGGGNGGGGNSGGGSAPPPVNTTVGTATNPVYGDSGVGMADPWGQHPGDHDYGYPPGKGPSTNYGQTSNGQNGQYGDSRDAATNEALIRQQYQTSLGRAPTAAELASDMDNARRYGWNSGQYGGVQATIANRVKNTPGAGPGGSGPGGGGTPLNNLAGGGGGNSAADWFGANGPQQWQPFTEQFQAPAGAPTGFKAPTESDMIANDPGYQTRMDAAQQAMQRSAAAKGNLLTGGTQKALGQAMQDYGSNEYQNYYGQKTNEYGLGVNDYNNAYGRAMGEYQNRYNVSTGNQTNQIGTQRNNMLDAYGMYSQDRQMSDQENAQAFNQYLGLNQLYANIGLGLSGQGLNGAGYLNQAGNGVGQALGNLGNANAAGTVQGANAWQNFYNNMANTWNPNLYSGQRR